MSVGTFDAFFGQLTQIIPARVDQRQEHPELAIEDGAAGDEDMGELNRRLGLVEPLERRRVAVDFLRGRGPAHSWNQARMPGFKPSFCASGVPE